MWYLSITLYRRGHVRSSRLLKALVYLFNQAVLPPEAIVGSGLVFGHFGGGVTVHPNVVMGRDVMVWHRVTLAVSGSPGSAARLVIGDKVTIGSGAAVVTPFERDLHVGAGAVIGANAVVTKDVPPNAVMVGNPARLSHFVGDGRSKKYR